MPYISYSDIKISSREIFNTLSSALFFLPLLNIINNDWLKYSTIFFSFFATLHHLIPYHTYYLTFVVKSLYTQFLFSIFCYKLMNCNLYLVALSIIISLIDLLSICKLNQFEILMGSIRQFVCLGIWCLSSDKYFTAIIYILGQLSYKIDRNLRLNFYQDRMKYTFYHANLHICDAICFYIWINSPID